LQIDDCRLLIGVVVDADFDGKPSLDFVEKSEI
jgi:hypothetical protein